MRLSDVRFPHMFHLNLARDGTPQVPPISTDLQEMVTRDFIHLKKLKLEADPVGKTYT